MKRIDIVKDLTTRASNVLLRGGIRTEEQIINGLLSGEIWIGRPRGCGEDVLSELCAVTGIDPAHLGGRKKASKPDNRKLDKMVDLVAPMLGALNLSGLSPEDRREWVADAVAVAEEAYTQLVAACTDKEDT